MTKPDDSWIPLHIVAAANGVELDFAKVSVIERGGQVGRRMGLDWIPASDWHRVGQARPGPRVVLYMVEQPVLIIERQPGITYSNQTGGHMCSQPEVEGVLVPLETPPDTQEALERWDQFMVPGAGLTHCGRHSY